MKKLYQLAFDKIIDRESKRIIASEIFKTFTIDSNPLVENFGELASKVDENQLANSAKIPEIIGASKLSLERIYNERTRTNQIIFVLSLLFCFIAVGLILYIGISNFKNLENSSSTNSWWGIILAVLTAILDGVLFWFYKQSNESRKNIENDIRFLAKLEGVVLTLDKINDEKGKIALLEKIILKLQV